MVLLLEPKLLLPVHLIKTSLEGSVVEIDVWMTGMLCLLRSRVFNMCQSLRELKTEVSKDRARMLSMWYWDVASSSMRFRSHTHRCPCP